MHVPPSETNPTTMPYAPETNTLTSTTPLLETNTTTMPLPKTSDSAGVLSASNPTTAPSSETDPAVTSSSTHSTKLELFLSIGGGLTVIVLYLLLLIMKLQGVVVRSAITAMGYTYMLACMLILELRNNNTLINLSCMTFFFLLFFLSSLSVFVAQDRAKTDAAKMVLACLAMLLWVTEFFVSLRFCRYLFEGNRDGLERLKRAFRIGPARAHRSQEVEVDHVAPYESV